MVSRYTGAMSNNNFSDVYPHYNHLVNFTGTVSLRLRGNVIPSNGAGSALITDIGPNNDDALICFSDQPNCCSGPGNWFVKYGSQQQRRVQSDDRVLGWMRNRSRNPTVVSVSYLSLIVLHHVFLILFGSIYSYQ